MAKLYYRDGAPVFITHKVDIIAAIRSGQVSFEDPTKAKVRKKIEEPTLEAELEDAHFSRPSKKRRDPVRASFGVSKED